MIKANNPKIKSWLEIPADSDFPIQNIPFGIFKYKSAKPKVCTRIGDHIIDLAKVNDLGYFADLNIPKSIFRNEYLNDFMALGKKTTREVRNRISELFNKRIKKWNSRELVENFTHPADQVEMLLPVKVGDYTDFYSSIEHATNLGKLFRDPKNALLPNWRHLPVGYHGRASSIIVSGTPIHRPKGQQMPAGAKKRPKQSPKVLPYLEYEGEKNYDVNLEVIIQPENAEGKRVSLSNFKYMYWNMTQQLAHHTVNGCNVNVGDMMASGTISGKNKKSYGSMLEISMGGKQSIKMTDGTERKFIQDGDTVIMKGWCEKDGIRIGFGEASGKVLPAI